MNLLDLQRRMSEDVRRPLTPDWNMQPASTDAAYIKPNDRLTSFERLEIYNQQYWFRVIAAVSEDYPALNAILGAKKFDALLLAYLKENPSTSFTLRNLGAKLPHWLGQHPEFTGSKQALAIDVARLEWAYVDAYDATRLPPLGAEDFVLLSADSTLRLQPHLQLLALQYPVDELVLQVRNETPEMDIVSNAASAPEQSKRRGLPKIRKSPMWLAVHRYDNMVYYRPIDREAYLLLCALRDGQSIAEALSTAFAGSNLTPEEQAAKIQKYFAHASELGWFCMPQKLASEEWAEIDGA